MNRMHRIHMTTIQMACCLLLAIQGAPHPAAAQDQVRVQREEAIEAYQAGDYTAVRERLRDDATDLGRLYFGKASFMDGRCGEAVPALWIASRSAESDLALDARYTLALCQIELRQYPAALRGLRDLGTETGASMASAARDLYIRLIAFLTPEQVLDAAAGAQDPEFVLDLYRYGSAPSDSPVVAYLHRSLSLALGEAFMESVRRVPIQRPPGSAPGSLTPPDGFVNRVEVLLPAGDSLDGETLASRSLYNGMMLAFEEHNDLGSPTQIHLSFTSLRTSAGASNAAQSETPPDADPETQAPPPPGTPEELPPTSIFEQVWFDSRPDLVIGPLYSETAVEWSRFASRHGVPVLTPLANSDQVGDLARPGIYQLNPTFEVHGRQMARYAVQRLGLRTIAILADRGSLGFRAASSFKEEAERLGAVVPTYFVEDLQQSGYDLSPFFERIETDPDVLDSLGLQPVDGVFAPFTGQAAQTLIRLLITGLEGKRSTAIILGSEEWDSEATRQLRPANLPVYYTSPFKSGSENGSMERFEESYALRFGMEPDPLAMVGYDLGSFVAGRLEKVGNPALLMESFAEPGVARGLVLDVEFDGRRVNQRVHVRRVQPGDAR